MNLNSYLIPLALIASTFKALASGGGHPAGTPDRVTRGIEVEYQSKIIINDCSFTVTINSPDTKSVDPIFSAINQSMQAKNFKVNPMDRPGSVSGERGVDVYIDIGTNAFASVVWVNVSRAVDYTEIGPGYFRPNKVIYYMSKNKRAGRSQAAQAIAVSRLIATLPPCQS